MYFKLHKKERTPWNRQSTTLIGNSNHNHKRQSRRVKRSKDSSKFFEHLSSLRVTKNVARRQKLTKDGNQFRSKQLGAKSWLSMAVKLLIWWEEKTLYYTLFFNEYLTVFRALIFLNMLDFEPRIILKLFLNTKGLNSPKNLRNTFQSLLVLYYIIKLISCIDDAKVYLKAVLQLGYKKFLCLDEAWALHYS